MWHKNRGQQEHIQISFIMKWHHIKIALRNLWKHRSYSLINILGLTIGLATFILTGLYILHEKSYDNQHPHASNTYRVVSKSDFNGVGEESTSAPCPLAPALFHEHQNKIKYITRVYNNWNSEYFIEHGDKGFKEQDFFFVDSCFKDVFQVEFIKGNPGKSLQAPMTVLITESAARRYFGNEDPVGQELQFEERYKFMVEGVIRDPQPNTHLKYDFLASMNSLKKFYRGKMPQTWYWNPFWTYLVLEDNVKAQQLQAQLPAFVEKYFPVAEDAKKSLWLQPVTDIHLNSHLDYEIETNGKRSYVTILSVIALFMLLIACINFMNLSTATAGSRAKEIGMKKVLGSNRIAIITQFLSEAVILSFISLLLSLVVVDVLIPPFNDLMDRNLEFSMLTTPGALAVLIAIGLLTGIIAGIYPAFYLSRFNPVQVLKGGNFSKNMNSGLSRKILVTFQFVISTALITGTVLMYHQLEYMRQADLGFDKDNVIMIPVSRTPVVSKYEAFEKELKKHPGVEYVTTTDYIVGTDHNNHEFKPEGYPDDEWQFYPTLIVREDFCSLFDIPLLAGRDFSRDNKTDATNAVLINEAMVDFMGWKCNEEALGKKFHSLSGKEKVVGVFRNFNVKSLHSEQTPLVLNIKENDRSKYYFTDYVVVRINGGQVEAALDHIQNTWSDFAPTRPFDFVFLEDEINMLYRDEDRLGQLSGILTLMVIFIALLGLYGLVSFLTNRRAREIGIRKTLGARLQDVIIIISSEFIILVLMAVLIAWPLTWFALHNWLENFAFQAPLSWWIFLISGIIALLLALVVTTMQSVKAYRVTAAETLKYE